MVRLPSVAARRAFWYERGMEPSDNEIETRFQEEHGAYVFQEGKPRAVLQVKSPNISTAIYEARLRGYDRASSNERPSGAQKK
jgi:hypothetical protein